jgi:hypothetical protein
MTTRVNSGVSRTDGYAILVVLFIVALILIGATTAELEIKTEGQRENETEMIWRGEQYQRAIGLYYRKFGRFPTSLDNLVKVQNGVRFLREAYKDPMNEANGADGSWRFIYVTPAGQLIGSVRYVSLMQMAMVDRARQMGVQLGQGALTQPNGLPSGSPSTGSGGISGSGTPGGNPGASPATQQNQGTGQNGAPLPGQQQPGTFGSPQPSPTTQQGQESQESESSGPVIGGFIIGVGSKIDKPSLKVFKGGTTYKQWEFIYNPLEQTQVIGGASVGPQGSTPAGQQPPNPTTPQPQQNQIPQTPQR